MLYSTCSLEPEECQGVVDAVLGKTNGRFRRVPMQETMCGLKASGRLRADVEGYLRWMRDGCLRTLPGVGFEGDGFFAALLEAV